MHPKQRFQGGDIIDTVEPRPSHFTKFKDYSIWPIPRSDYFVRIMEKNRNWKRLLIQIDLEMDEVLMESPQKRRYSQLSLALMGKKIIQCGRCSRHLPSYRALVSHDSYCIDSKQGKPYEFTRVFRDCLLCPLGNMRDCNQFTDDMALKQHLKKHSDEELHMLGLRRVDLDFVTIVTKKKTGLNLRSGNDESEEQEDKQDELEQMNDVSFGNMNEKQDRRTQKNSDQRIQNGKEVSQNQVRKAPLIRIQTSDDDVVFVMQRNPDPNPGPGNEIRKRDSKYELKTTFKNCSVETLIELCDSKSPFVEMANRLLHVDKRASNWNFPKQFSGKDSGSGKSGEWFFKFVRDDGVASRTDVKEFYFAEERVRFLIASPKLNFLAPIDIQFLDDQWPIRTHTILGQRIANDAYLLESFPDRDRKQAFQKLVSQVFQFNDLDCYHGDIRLDEIYYSKSRDRFYLVNPAWMWIANRALPFSDPIRKGGPVHQDSFEAMRGNMYDKIALLWVLADIEFLNDNPESPLEDRPSKFFRNPDRLADWEKNGTQRHHLLQMNGKGIHDSEDGYYSLAQVCVKFLKAGSERNLKKYFFYYELLHSFLRPQQVNQELAKWVKFEQSSRFKGQSGKAPEGEQKQVKVKAGPDRTRDPDKK